MKITAVRGSDVSAAWLAACQAMTADPPVAYHTVVRIENPLAEDPAVRAAVDGILRAASLRPVQTVANTIFPAAVAATSRDQLDLTRRYLKMLPTLRDMDPANKHGMYFERLISYPGREGPVNQLDAIISRLRKETAKAGTGTGPLSAAYEAGFAVPDEDDGDRPAEDCVSASHVPVRVPGQDSRVRGFPCLSHCSFQLDRSGSLHAMAHYRSQLMVERAYGNYLGLGRLLGYVAGQAGLRVGELTVTAGYASLDQQQRLKRFLASHDLEPAALFGRPA